MEAIFSERLLQFARHIYNYSCAANQRDKFDIIISRSLIEGRDISLKYKINSWIINEMINCFDSWYFNEINQEPMWIESDPDGGNCVSSFIEFFGFGSEDLDDMPHLLSIDGKYQNVAKYGGIVLSINSNAKDIAFNINEFVKKILEVLRFKIIKQHEK